MAEVDTLGEESLSFGSLYFIQGGIMNSQLQPRDYQASLRSFSGQKGSGR